MPKDLRQAVRVLARVPGFTAAVVLTLALGTGANIASFSALNSLLLRPLPYPDPGRLVSLYETTVDRKPRGVAEANLLDWRERTTAFEALAAYQPRSFGLTRHDRDQVTVIQTGMVMAGFFRVLAVPIPLGRSFTEQEEIAEAHLIVLTDRLWRRMFDADPAAIGRTVELNEEPYTVVGVMPPGFEYPMDRVTPEAFLPLSRKDYCCGRLGSQDAIARIKPGISRERANAELESAAAALAVEYPVSNGGRSAGLRPLAEVLSGSRREPLFLLIAATGLLLLIACANVAGLILARSFSRGHEVAIRIALGAGWKDIVRQCLAEAALLTAGGAGLGSFAAAFLLRAAPRLAPIEPLHLDAAAFGFALALASSIALLLAVAPALLLRGMDLHRRAGCRTAGHSRNPVRGILVVAQVSLSVVLLLSTGVLLRSFLHLLATNPGFEPAHAYKFGIGLPEKRYDTDLKLIDFHARLSQALRDLPGVESAGASLRLPLRGGGIGSGGTFQIAGANIPVPQRPRSWVNVASPGYFDAMKIPLIAGRDFSWRDDRAGSQRVAIVNQTFARAYLTGRRALGALLEVRWVSELNPAGSVWQVVGIAGDTRQASLDRDAVPEIFLSMTQVGSEGAVYVFRGERPGLPQSVALAVARLDPRIERISLEPMTTLVERTLGSRSLAIRLVGGFGGLALLLTAVGIYGIVSFRAAERSREMAIRLALGATAAKLRRLVWGHALSIAALGSAVGVAAFLPASALLKSQLYGVSAADGMSILAVVLLVGAASLAAAWAPGRRARKIEPVNFLRDA